MSNEEDFLRKYLKTIRPFTNLKECEEELLIELSKLCRVRNTEDIKIALEGSNRQLLCDQLGYKKSTLAVSLSNLRKNKIIINDKLNPIFKIYNLEGKYQDLTLTIEFKLNE